MAVEFESVKWLATLGVGGVMAGGMFLFYRKDSNDKGKRVEELAEGNGRLAETVLDVVQKNAAASVQLAAAVDQMTDLLWRMKNGG